MQTLLLALVLFLGFQLFFGPRGPGDTRTSDTILTSLRELNAKAEDPVQRGAVASRVQSERSLLDRRTREEEQAGKLTAGQGKERRLEAMVLTGHTLMRAGAVGQDTGPLTVAYFMMNAEDKQFGEELWSRKSFAVKASESFPASELSAKLLLEQVIGELHTQSKNHLILGFLPGFRFIDYLVNLTGAIPGFSYAFAAFLLALIVRALIWPLAQKQYLWGRQMSRLQPLVKELKERYTDKKTGKLTNMQEFNQKQMALFREYGFNPMAGCLPMLIQIPYFLIVYQCMVQYRFEFQKGSFLWINPSLGQASGGWVAPNLGERDYILVAIYAVSMVVTTMLTPVTDPSNMRQQRIMGVGIAVFFSITMFFYPLPSAFVLYWVFTNLFTTAQMLRAYRMPLPALVKVNAPGGGVLPVEPTPRSNGQPRSTGVPVKHRPKKKR